MEPLFTGFSAAGGMVVRALLAFAALFALGGAVTLVWYGARAVRLLGLRLSHLHEADKVLARGDVYYAPGHLWMRPEGDGVRVGLDDLVRRVLPRADAVELVQPGAKVRVGEPIGWLKIGRRTVTVPAPIDGEVTAVNETLAHHPSLLRLPYTRGWLVELHPNDERYTVLPHDEGAVQWLRKEQEMLSGRVEHELGVTRTDGPLAPWQVSLPAARRVALAEGLLRTRA